MSITQIPPHTSTATGHDRGRRASVTRSAVGALVLAAGSLAAAGSPNAQDAAIVVDSTSDVSDFGGARQVGDLPGADGRVTLREAITASNNTAGANTIVFAIPTSDPGLIGDEFFLFVEDTPLVVTDGATTIDATTQVTLTGHRVHIRTTPPFANMNGLTINSAGNRLIGLAGMAMFRYGIELNGDNNVVTGSMLVQAMSASIHVTGANNVIGGTTPGAGNSIRSSGGDGVWIRGTRATGNVVQGNLITGHHFRGVSVADGAAGNILGGTSAAARNVINTNGHASSEGTPVGAQVAVAGSNNAVTGNYIGVDAGGTQAAGGWRPAACSSREPATGSAERPPAAATSSPVKGSSPRSSPSAPPASESMVGRTSSSRATRSAPTSPGPSRSPTRSASRSPTSSSTARRPAS
jgi:hypothetical protein